MTPATLEATAAEAGAGAGGECGRHPPTPSVYPGSADFLSSGSSSSDDCRTSSDSSNSNDSGDIPALVGRPAQDLEHFGELLTL